VRAGGRRTRRPRNPCERSASAAQRTVTCSALDSAAAAGASGGVEGEPSVAGAITDEPRAARLASAHDRCERLIASHVLASRNSEVYRLASGESQGCATLCNALVDGLARVSAPTQLVPSAGRGA
jgi:hypothetical protein